VEATALGNVLVQAVAAGRLPNIATGRQVVAASFTQMTYEPRPDPAWDAAFERMLASMRRSVGQVGPHA
jgi:rhamnulokinase